MRQNGDGHYGNKVSSHAVRRSEKLEGGFAIHEFEVDPIKSSYKPQKDACVK